MYQFGIELDYYGETNLNTDFTKKKHTIRQEANYLWHIRNVAVISASLADTEGGREEAVCANKTELDFSYL